MLTLSMAVRDAVEQLPILTMVKDPTPRVQKQKCRQLIYVPIALLSTLRQKGKRGLHLPKQEV